jgi:alanine racemase
VSRPAQLQINLSALQHNFKRVKAVAPHSAVMAILKANAYGHGLKKIGLALTEADAFGVACLEEAVMLREAGVKQPIVLLEGFYQASELATISALDLEISVHQHAQLEILEKQTLAKPVAVWLKVDTGMHRLGFAPTEVKTVWQRLRACAAVKPDIRIMSHFARAEEVEHPETFRQITCFAESIAGLSAPCSLANSAGILAWPAAHKEWVRPGIMLYGVAPFADKINADYDLKPVMTLRSEIIAIKNLHKGDTVGYGGTWVCPQDMNVGVIAMGYGDGYPRDAQNGTPVLVNNKAVPLVARVSMDMLTVDLRTQPQAKIGDPVILWGDGLPIEKIAQYTGTNVYELLCKVTPRVYCS